MYLFWELILSPFNRCLPTFSCSPPPVSSIETLNRDFDCELTQIYKSYVELLNITPTLQSSLHGKLLTGAWKLNYFSLNYFQGQCLSLHWCNHIWTTSHIILSWSKPAAKLNFSSCNHTRQCPKWTNIPTSHSGWDDYTDSKASNDTYYQGISCNSKSIYSMFQW